MKTYFNSVIFRQKFGQVISLSDKQKFLDAVDKEEPNIVVVVHLYNEVHTISRGFEGVPKAAITC